jgi:hypothetical protein
VGGPGSGRWFGLARRRTTSEAFAELRAPRGGPGAPASALAELAASALVGAPGGRVAWAGAVRGGRAGLSVDVRFEAGADARGRAAVRMVCEWTVAGGPRRAAAIRLEATPLRYGPRWWLCCPACGARRAALYLPTAHAVGWACRACARLAYATQRLDATDRAGRRMRRLRERLGIPAGHSSAAYPGGLPPKPPRMHFRTFARLRAELEAAEVRFAALFVALAVARFPYLRHLTPPAEDGRERRKQR